MIRHVFLWGFWILVDVLYTVSCIWQLYLGGPEPDPIAARIERGKRNNANR
jgi:hypothetical protein